MKRKRYAEQQIVFALQQAEAGTPVAGICRKMAIASCVCQVLQKPGGVFLVLTLPVIAAACGYGLVGLMGELCATRWAWSPAHPCS